MVRWVTKPTAYPSSCCVLFQQVTWEAVEAAFWQIVEEGEEAVDVIYGADLDTTVLGSGFPKKDGRMGGDRYALEPWNLNNFPRLQGKPCCQFFGVTLLAYF